MNKLTKYKVRFTTAYVAAITFVLGLAALNTAAIVKFIQMLVRNKALFQQILKPVINKILFGLVTSLGLITLIGFFLPAGVAIHKSIREYQRKNHHYKIVKNMGQHADHTNFRWDNEFTQILTYKEDMITLSDSYNSYSASQMKTILKNNLQLETISLQRSVRNLAQRVDAIDAIIQHPKLKEINMEEAIDSNNLIRLIENSKLQFITLSDVKRPQDIGGIRAALENNWNIKELLFKYMDYTNPLYIMIQPYLHRNKHQKTLKIFEIFGDKPHFITHKQYEYIIRNQQEIEENSEFFDQQVENWRDKIASLRQCAPSIYWTSLTGNYKGWDDKKGAGNFNQLGRDAWNIIAGNLMPADIATDLATNRLANHPQRTNLGI